MLRPRLLLLLLLASPGLVRAAEVEEAVCVLASALQGEIRLRASPGNRQVEFSGQIVGLSPGKHGFHVHEHGNLSESCKAAGGHYNPHQVNHGDRNGQSRHAGDFGNILVEETSNISHIQFTSTNSTLDSLLGRAIVVHAKEDDLGLGGTEESSKTGSAGPRLDCCVITSEGKSEAGRGRTPLSLILLLSIIVRIMFI